MSRETTTNVRRPTTPFQGGIEKLCSGWKNDQRAARVARTIASSAARAPPNAAATTTERKKNINGSSVGPTTGVNASRDAQPAATLIAATPKRSHAGRLA